MKNKVKNKIVSCKKANQIKWNQTIAAIIESKN